MGRHLARVACLSGTVLALVGVSVENGTSALGATQAISAKLVGKWTRKITSADVRRSGAYTYQGMAGAVCTLTIKKTSAAHLDCTIIGSFYGTIVPAGVNRVHINLSAPLPNVYKWRVSRRLLTFTKVRDASPDRAAGMDGVWKRTEWRAFRGPPAPLTSPRGALTRAQAAPNLDRWPHRRRV